MRLLCLLIVGCSLLAAGCASELPQRYQRTQVNEQFRFAGMPFADYLVHVRKLIAKNRLDLTPQNKAAVVEANSPFEWKPDPGRCASVNKRGTKNGVLLVHGLSDSPFMMRDLGRFFLSRCFLVRSILLPGHGTVPGDLLKVEFTEWVKAVAYGLDSLHGKVDAIYLAGFSTGGTLAVYHAVNDANIKALLLFAPAIKIKTNLGFMANWHKSISWGAEKKKWIDIADDEDYAKYESFTFNAADQIYLLTKELNRRLGKRMVSAPIFLAISEDDMTVDAGDAIRFFSKQRNPQSRMILYTNRNTGDRGGDRRILRKKSRHPEQSVLDYSHTAIPVAPGNPHYGRNGDYKNCMHYLGNPGRWKVCKAAGKDTHKGEITKENLKRHTVLRLTYNPEFDDMLSQIGDFLDRLN